MLHKIMHRPTRCVEVFLSISPCRNKHTHTRGLYLFHGEILIFSVSSHPWVDPVKRWCIVPTWNKLTRSVNYPEESYRHSFATRKTMAMDKKQVICFFWFCCEHLFHSNGQNKTIQSNSSTLGSHNNKYIIIFCFHIITNSIAGTAGANRPVLSKYNV